MEYPSIKNLYKMDEVTHKRGPENGLSNEAFAKPDKKRPKMYIIKGKGEGLTVDDLFLYAIGAPVF